MSETATDTSAFVKRLADISINNALDSCISAQQCEAWYEVMENVLLWQYPDDPKEVRTALNYVREAIDERWGEI